jgi:hypothetical protein
MKTREEAEAVAAKLVGVQDDSFDANGDRVPVWEVTLAGNVIGYLRSARSKEEADERATAWREAIVRALVGESQ